VQATELVGNARGIELSHQVASPDANKYCISGEKQQSNCEAGGVCSGGCGIGIVAVSSGSFVWEN